jgi:hypothetical protein
MLMALRQVMQDMAERVSWRHSRRAGVEIG